MHFRYSKIIMMCLALLLLLVIVPSGFAADNYTANDTSIAQTDEVDGDLIGRDYYFDANDGNATGDGSRNNPYNALSDSRIKDDSVIHLANGDYSLTQKRTYYSNVSFYGEDAEKTVINGNGGLLVVKDIFNLKDVTLNNFSIVNNGDLKAANVIFSNGISQKVDNTYDTYGSSISTSGKNHQVILDNCTFINNYAQYGGAIYQKGGSLVISDSTFINSTALNYGGAIFCDAYDSKKAKVRITNTRFINSTSVNDAGGAIYLISSYLDADNVFISHSSATFGGALTLLSSYSKLYNMNLNNNRATYSGGAIYHMYGNLTVINSSFIRNSAKNVGALYMDTCDFFSIQNNMFIDNSASGYVGAFYSLLNDYGYLRNNTFMGNSALMYGDSLETMEVYPFISNGNYTMYMYTSFDGVLPIRYSSCDKGYVTSVKTQGDGGNCWAFSTLSTLESCIIKASGEHIDLSVENMKNIMGLYSDYGWNRETNEGGYDGMGIGYLTGWLGPVLEEDDSYDATSQLSPLLDSIMHVQNIVYLKRSSYTDNNAIKRAIMDYGAVNTQIYMDATYYSKINAFGQYCDRNVDCDHSVSLVGWDDSIWIPGAPGSGAWIAKNSWGADWGNDGYFYVSYYDRTCAKVGENLASFTFVLNDTIRYDKNYQYDIPGSTNYLWSDASTVWYRNIFNATDNEYLSEVSTYFEKDTNWQLSVNVNGELKLTKSGHTQAGYYTIDLGEFIPLNAGDIFEVIFKINVKGNAGVPISEIISLNKYFYREGVSFISYDGKNWEDLYEFEWEYGTSSYSSQVACIKAFTVFDEIGTCLHLDVSYNGFNPVVVTASVMNQYGYPVDCGRVTFNLSGEIFTVDVSDGIAGIAHDFKRGLNSISAVFNAAGYCQSGNSTYLNIIKYDADMNMSVKTSMNTAVVNVILSDAINDTVILTLNGEKSYSSKSTSGFVAFNLSDLDYGLNEIVASLHSPLYEANDSTGNFTIGIKKTEIAAGNLITVYNSGEMLNITLIDKYYDDLSQKPLEITLNGKAYSLTTAENGFAQTPISLSCGTYNMDIRFRGDENYLPSQKTVKITVKTSIIFTSSTYTYYAKYSVQLLNKLGAPLANRYVKIIMNKVTYSVRTNGNGYALLYIKLAPGTYAVKVTNPETGEVKSQNIKVAARISQNRDMSVYYGSGSYYKVKVLNDYAKLEKGLKVKFTINGKTYTAATDKNGIASFKINLNPKTYRITASYSGFKVTNKVTVKTTIITKNMLVKKSNVIRFNAKLLNSNGKILKYKIITFKMSGNTYKVKTDARGVATVSLNNLKVGKYTIISAYSKLSVKNTITVR